MGLSVRASWALYAILFVFTAIPISIWPPFGFILVILAASYLTFGTLFLVVYPKCKKDSKTRHNTKPTKTNNVNDLNKSLSDNDVLGSMNKSDIMVIMTNNDEIEPKNSEELITKSETQDMNTEKEEQIVIPKTIKPKKVRLHYLDNLKSILTAIVVIHHVTCAFVGIGWYYMLGRYWNSFQPLGNVILLCNQMYFMCLFFFISGYFSPTSLDRKGRFMFMADKFKRLGIPFLVYYYIIGPLTLYAVHKGILNRDYGYTPDAGPCWFICWLIIFNSLYIIMDTNVPTYKMDFPKPLKIILCGMGVALVQYVVILVIRTGTYIFMPISFGSFPFDVLFFVGGIIAKRNNWLSEQIKEYGKNMSIVKITAVFSCLLIVFICVFPYFAGWEVLIYPSKESTNDCDAEDPTFDVKWYMNAMYIVLFLASGVFCLSFSISLIDWSRIYLNFTGPKSQFFSKAAYTVYIIHPPIVILATWSYTLIQKGINNVVFIFCDSETFSRTDFGNDGFVYFGWFYACFVSLIVVWPLGYIIKKLPGFKHIL